MKYTITWTRVKHVVILHSFAGMILWVSDPKWEWALGRSVERVIKWVEDPPNRNCKAAKYAGAMRWSVSE